METETETGENTPQPQPQPPAPPTPTPQPQTPKAKTPSPTHYKLFYFNLKGKAEVIRMLFHIAGQDFDDKRFTIDEWKSVKPKLLRYQQAPILEVIEETTSYQIAQSHTIERFLANRFNLLGKSEIERVHVDMIGEEIVDLYTTLIVIYRKKDCEEKARELDEAIREKVPIGLKLIQSLLEANRNLYLVGDEITLADIQLINFYDWLRNRKNEVLDKLPSLKKHDEFIRTLPKVSDYLKRNAYVRLTILFPN